MAILKTIRARIAEAISGEKFATRQSDPWGYLLTGHRRPEKRGHDEYGAKEQRLAQQIDTQRQRDPILFRAINYFDQLALGSGITWSCDDKALSPIIRAIWRVNRLDKLQHTMAIELAATGNIFNRVPQLKAGGGKTNLEYVPAIELLPSCQIMKIATDPDGAIWYYRREWEAANYPEPLPEPKKAAPGLSVQYQKMVEDIPASEIVHAAVNRSAQELRGLSMLQPVVHWSQLYGRTVETVWMMAMAKAMLFVHAKVESADETQLQTFIDAIEAQMVTRTDPAGFDYQTVPVGQILATNKGVELDVVGGEMRGGSSDDEMRRVLLMAAAGLGLPEVFLSDGNYANLASSMTQSNPFFRLMDSFQAEIVTTLREILRLCLDRLDESGMLPTVALGDGQDHAVDLIQLNAPDILSTDITTLGPVLVQLVQNDMMSRQRAASMLGESWDDIAQQIEDEKGKGYDNNPGAAGQLPGLPFPAEYLQVKLAADPAKGPDGKPRHPEVYAKMKKIREGMKATLDAYRNALLLAGENQTEQAAALATYTAEMGKQFRELFSVTKDVGKESIANG